MEYRKRTTHVLELSDSDVIALGDLVRIIFNARGTLLIQGEQQAVDLVLELKKQMDF